MQASNLSLVQKILQFTNPSLKCSSYDTAVLHFAIKNLLQKVRCKSDAVENLVETKRKPAVKCISQGVSKMFVSAIVQNKRIFKF